MYNDIITLILDIFWYNHCDIYIPVGLVVLYV